MLPGHVAPTMLLHQSNNSPNDPLLAENLQDPPAPSTATLSAYAERHCNAKRTQDCKSLFKDKHSHTQSSNA